jgi:hypothetical protein
LGTAQILHDADRNVSGHAPRDQQAAALPMCRAISAETMKMPEPIIAPTTTIVE